MATRASTAAARNGAGEVVLPGELAEAAGSVAALGTNQPPLVTAFGKIPKINLAGVLLHLVGRTPIITQKFGERAMKQIEDKQTRQARTEKPPRDPQAEFLDALYIIKAPSQPHLVDGLYGIPGAGIKKALVSAGGRFADEKMTFLRGVLNIEGDLIAINAPEPVRRADHVTLSGGVSSIAYRPQFDNWTMDVDVVYNANSISKEQVVNLFQIAGFAIGLGAWRPEKNGTFGQFRVDSIEAYGINSPRLLAEGQEDGDDGSGEDQD